MSNQFQLLDHGWNGFNPKYDPDKLFNLSSQLNICMSERDNRYFEYFTSGDVYCWYLLRHHKPVVIAGVNINTNTLFGIKGKDSLPPIHYIPDICFLINHTKCDIKEIHGFLEQMNVTKINGEWIGVYDIPDNCCVNHDLNLNNYRIRWLPSGLTIKGKLSICNNIYLKVLPVDIQADIVDIRFTKLENIDSLSHLNFITESSHYYETT